MKKLITPLSILYLMFTPLFNWAQFWDTFESYANQTAADASWVTTDVSNARVNITNDNIDINSIHDNTTDVIYYDLGAGNVSNSQWVLRGVFNFSSIAANNAGMYFGISSTTGGQTTSVQDAITMCWRAGSPLRIAHFDADNSIYIIGTDVTNYNFTTGVNYYVEIIRTSTTSFDVNIFTNSDYSTGQVINYTGATAATVQNFRYIKIANNDGNTGPGNVTGTLDDVQFCDGTTTFNCNPSPLPIELLSFSAKWKDEKHQAALIEWQTINETNNDFFEIQRSIDGINFNTIMQADGAGTTTQTINYEELDTEPYRDGTSYYRLKQVDFDGTFYYSQVEVLSVHEGLEIINLFPNPVYNNLHFSLFSSVNTEININVYNPLGQIVQNKSMQINVGISDIDLNSERLMSGKYYLEIITNDKQYKAQQKFVVNNEN